MSTSKAGRYELLALRWDKQTSKPGQPFEYVRYHQGDVVELNAEDAARLLAAGAVGEPGARQRAAAAAAKAVYEAALAQIPAELRDQLTAADPAPAEPSTRPGETDPDPAASPDPAAAAAKEAADKAAAEAAAANGGQKPPAGTGSNRR